jgi:UDP:flavonoid glycosyltransferase YjiC (YdhE family)
VHPIDLPGRRSRLKLEGDCPEGRVGTILVLTTLGLVPQYARVFVRAVFVTVPAAGHLDPMVPLALEMASAGHGVTVASGSDMVDRAAKLGLPAMEAGLSQLQAGAEMRKRFRGGLRRGPEQSKTVGPFFTDIVAAPMVADLMAALAGRPPDLIVHDPAAYAGPLVARLLGLPSVCHHYSAPGNEIVEHWGQAVAPLWDRWGCPTRPLGGIFDYLVLGLCPPSLWSPDLVKFPTARRIRPMWTDSDKGAEWLTGLNDDPTVYVSFGTAFGSAELFRIVIDALLGEALNVIVTIGSGTDPGPLDPQRPNVRIERYVPQAALLPYCDLVVCHGGSGTMLGAVAHGLPMLLLPMGADHFFNAEMCQSAGVARVLASEALTPETVRHEVLALFDDHTYRARATMLRDEVHEMPSPAAWVLPLEQLALEGQLA